MYETPVLTKLCSFNWLYVNVLIFRFSQVFIYKLQYDLLPHCFVNFNISCGDIVTQYLLRVNCMSVE